jgi:hypothetical protein
MAGVSRTLGLIIAGVTGLLILILVSGCGGGENQSRTTRAPRSADVAPPRLSAADEKAYPDIQKTSGDLRAAAIPVTYRSAAAIASAQLSADVRELRAVKPQDALLRRLRRSALKAVSVAISQPRGASVKAAAAAAIAEADRIDAGLRRYAASHPAANEIAPG